jgi:formate hydrogenlyase subunit 4
MPIAAIIQVLLALLLAPLLPGVINRVKAFFAGRCGQPLLQSYYDILKLLRKGAVYSRTTSWVFRAGPIAGLAAAMASLTVLPLGGNPAVLAFHGDLLLFAYLLGLMRFVTMTAALDTGSAFEGMGASREAWFAMLAEPALLLGLAAMAVHTGSLSLSGMLDGLALADIGGPGAPLLLLVAVAFTIVLLTENARIPVDDPNTHLELTMIHEVMVLDHSGPDFGIILYSAALKMWLLGQVLVGLVVPVHTGILWIDTPAALLAMAFLAVLVGIIESSMARVRLLHVPQLLVGATTLSILAVVLVLR